MSTGSSTPHDRLVKAVLDEHREARETSPGPLAVALIGQLADEPPRPVEGSFVNPTLSELFSDLYELEHKRGGHLFVDRLGHKSSSEPRVALRRLQCMVEVREHLARRTAGELSQVVPLLVLHGEKPWAVEPLFQALVQQGAYLGGDTARFRDGRGRRRCDGG